MLLISGFGSMGFSVQVERYMGAKLSVSGTVYGLKV